MPEKIKCPKCGKSDIESYRHSAVGTGELPEGKGEMTYKCLNPNCGYEFDEDDLE